MQPEKIKLCHITLVFFPFHFTSDLQTLLNYFKALYDLALVFIF